MHAAHMQKLKRFIQSVLEACSDYMDMLEKQRIRTYENHQTPKSTNEQTLTDYVTTEIKMFFGTGDNKSDSLKKMILDSDVYTPFMISDFLRDRSKHRSTYCRLIQELLSKGLPFTIRNIKLFHFKLPSQGPYQALHFM